VGAGSLDHLLDGVDHQLRLLNLNVVAAFGRDDMRRIRLEPCEFVLARRPGPFDRRRETSAGKSDGSWNGRPFEITISGTGGRGIALAARVICSKLMSKSIVSRSL